MHRHKAKRKVEAVILLQTWWRLLLMRHKGKQHRTTIIRFYGQLRVYKEILLAAEREKDCRCYTNRRIGG